METLKEFYTFQGIPLVFAFIVIVLTLIACIGTIRRHHYQATTAIKEQYKEYKKHATEQANKKRQQVSQKYKSKDNTEGAKTKPEKGKKENPPQEEMPENEKLKIRNEVVEKATLNAIMQVTGYLGIGFLLLTLIAAAF